MEQREGQLRRTFLCLGISLTLLGCVIISAGLAMPGWQILDLPELNAVHEHAIFYDCILSEVTPLDALRRARAVQAPLPVRHTRDVSLPIRPSRRCAYKFAGSAWETKYVRMAIEEGDFAAKEHLNLHRFLPQHKAVIFFCIFTLIFAILSVLVGACSSCFVPNGILHVISVTLATSCSLLADVSFFMASQRDENRKILGTIGAYQQHLSYAFFIHCLGSLVFVCALLCSVVAAYLLLAKECRKLYWRRKMKRSAGQNMALEEVEDRDRLEKYLLLSEVLSLRPRMDTVGSMEERQLPPPPPTPQQQQQQQLRLSVCSAASGHHQRERSGERKEMARNSAPNVRTILTSPKEGSYCSAV